MAGIAGTISVPVHMYVQMDAAERAAATLLERIADAQRDFRDRNDRRGYATALASLTTPCPGDERSALELHEPVSPYEVTLRAADRAVSRGTDCHGRPVASDFYAAAWPTSAVAGRQAFAVTARGRIYVFFDGIAPRESDFAFGGLAVPLDAIETFKIP
jgi:hypothetical protein